jgi:hypothetical protein
MKSNTSTAKKKRKIWPGESAQAYNPRNSEGGDQEDCGSKSELAKICDNLSKK